MRSYIPTINISSLVKSKFNSQSAKNTIRKIEKACVEVGFFQITGHGINNKILDNISFVGKKFFNSSIKNKMKLAPKKWNNINKNIYRGYFPNNVNGKEGLDIGDLKVTKKYALKIKCQYIECLELNRAINKKSIKILNNYFDKIFILGEILFKSIIQLYNKDTKNFKLAFSPLSSLVHHGSILRA